MNFFDDETAGDYPLLVAMIMENDAAFLQYPNMVLQNADNAAFNMACNIFKPQLELAIDKHFKELRANTMCFSTLKKRQRISNTRLAITTVHDDLAFLRDEPLKWETLCAELVDDFISIYDDCCAGNTVVRATMPPGGIAQSFVHFEPIPGILPSDLETKPVKKRPLPEGSRYNPVCLDSDTESEVSQPDLTRNETMTISHSL